MTVWSLRYNKYDPKVEKLRETLCTVGNGYFATRGAAPEAKADDSHYPGTYIAGCYNRLTSNIEGRVVENESLVNLPNWLPLTFKIVEDEDSGWFDLRKVEILNYNQELDLRRGVLTRKIRFRDGHGRTTRLAQRRFSNMEYPHLAGLDTKVTAENWSGRMKFLAALDGRVTNSGVENYRLFNKNHLVSDEQFSLEDDLMYLSVKTSQSEIKVVETARVLVRQEQQDDAGRPVSNQIRRKTIKEPSYVGQEFEVELGQDKESSRSVTIDKLVALYTSRDPAISECGEEAVQSARTAPRFEELIQSHARAWNDLWRRYRIRVVGDDHAALVVHVHLFHLLQTVSPNSVELDVGIPARGLHGEAYRGHIFWDQLFVFPLLNIHSPDLTRSLLMYRFRRLPAAKAIAESAGFRGAMYPWESGSDGREDTPELQLDARSNRWVEINTRLQHHVDAAIAFDLWTYYQVSHDLNFLAAYGAEMILEIARFFGSAARRRPGSSKGRYEITSVMGPDEYHYAYPGSNKPGINNNAYTNVMAVWVLQKAIEVLGLIPKSRREGLLERLQLRDEELKRWETISRRMFVPFQDGGIISEFEGYDNLKELDWEGYRRKYGDIQNLDGILAAEGDSANNYKVSKQADVLMLFYLFSPEELAELFRRLGYHFDRETIQKNVEYYAKRTSHGSTLSRIVHAWILARLDRERSWSIAKEALESDLSDIQGGTSPEGIHLGAMAGTVEIIERCYVGLVTRNDVLWFDPCLPSELKNVLFTIFYRGHVFKLNLTAGTLEVTSSPGPAPTTSIGFRGRVLQIASGQTKKFRIPKSARWIGPV